MITRLFLFLATNFAILIVFSIVLRILSAAGVIQPETLGGYAPLLVFAALFGFGGAFISLALSKTIAKWSTGARVIERPGNPTEAWLVERVEALARQAGIGTPEVAIYDSPDLNAFATGARRNASLVAVSAGLLQGMSRDEVEGVLAHEVSHVANGDMVTMTLLQGVLNTFVLFFSRIIGSIVDSALSGGRQQRGPGIGYWVATIVAELVLALLATIIVMWFSRWREFRADAGGANLAGNHKMIAALERLHRSQVGSQLPESLHAFGIRDGSGSLLAGLFRSHPPLGDRIDRLKGLL